MGFCLDVNTAKQESLSSSLDIDCTTAACPDQCSCSLDKCASEINACLAVDNCAKAQTCALACPCSDNACILKCAASRLCQLPSASILSAALLNSAPVWTLIAPPQRALTNAHARSTSVPARSMPASLLTIAPKHRLALCHAHAPTMHAS